MPKTLLLSGLQVRLTSINHSDVDRISSPYKHLSIDDIPQEEYDTTIIDVHGRNPKREKGNFLIGLFGQEEGKPKTYALEQLLLLQKRTGATNIFLLSCFAGALVNKLARMKPEELQNLGFKAGTQIMVFSSSNNSSLSSKSSDIIRKIIEHGSVASNELAREVSIEYAVTVKSCQIHEKGEVKVGQKHNLHKYPELYMRLMDPDNEITKREWSYISQRFKDLESFEKRGGSFLDYEKEEFKKLKDMFRLYELYKDHTSQITDSFFDEALIESANRSKVRRSEQWLDLGADINYSDSVGQTPLIAAIEDDANIDIIFMLLSRGADPDKAKKDKTTPLIEAINNRRSDIAEALLRYNANPNTPNQFGETPLILAAKNNDIELATLLLEKNANLKAVDRFNKTALQYATHPNFIQFLEKALAKQNAESSPHPLEASSLSTHQQSRL